MLLFFLFSASVYRICTESETVETLHSWESPSVPYMARGYVTSLWIPHLRVHCVQHSCSDDAGMSNIELRYSFGKSRTSSPKLSEERDPTLKIGAFCNKGIVVRKKSPPGLWYAVIISLGFNQKYPFNCVPLSEYHKLSLFIFAFACFFFIVQSTKFADFDPNSYLDYKEHSYVSLEVTSFVFPCTSIIKNLNFTQECWTVSTLVLQQFFSWSVYWSSSRLNQRLDKHIMLSVVLMRTLLRASCINDRDCFVWYVSKSCTQCEEAVFW